MEKEMKKAVIYARQSSGSDDFSESVENQILNCQKLAKKENLEVVGIFQDLNTSGKTYPKGGELIAENDIAFNNWFNQQTKSKKFREGLGKAFEISLHQDIFHFAQHRGDPVNGDHGISVQNIAVPDQQSLSARMQH